MFTIIFKAGVLIVGIAVILLIVAAVVVSAVVGAFQGVFGIDEKSGKNL